MPAWAVGLVCSVVIALGGFMLKYLIQSAGTLGRIETKLDNHATDIEAIQKWQLDHTAEHVAYRNGYWEQGGRQVRGRFFDLDH